MKGKRYTKEQIAFALRRAESGILAVEVRRKMGVSEKSFYAWISSGVKVKSLWYYHVPGLLLGGQFTSPVSCGA